MLKKECRREKNPGGPAMKSCTYCGRDNDEARVACQECGTELVDSQAAAVPMRLVWKRTLLVVGAITAVLLGVVVLPLYLLGLVIRVPYPPQPKFGFAGEWRLPDVFGVEERPLPAAKDIWRDYEQWTPKTPNRRRVYVARLGGGFRQSMFQSSTNLGDTPVGAYRYTHADFVYADPTNGTYAITWMLRGEHDTRFLRFNASQRLYQLELYGSPDDNPPRLSIRAIEGIKPENP